MSQIKKENLFYIPGAKESFDAAAAEELGAFEETAISEAEAMESTLELKWEDAHDNE